MKIDLHIHTKKIASGDPETRSINPDLFKEIMKASNVGIAAITNHYAFDKNQYYQMRDEKYLLLPGVELDILINERRVQANVICPPDESSIKTLQDLLEGITTGEVISYKSFKEKFNLKKWIITPDFKNSGKTSWFPDEIRTLESEMDKVFILSDTNKSTTLTILNSHNFNALIGSDVVDWKNYESDSKKLLDTKFYINDYSTFWSILKGKKVGLSELFKNISHYEFKDVKMPLTTYSIKNILIKDGVNVIFGAKKTGKTEILKHMKSELKNKSVFYSSSEKETEISAIEKSLLDLKMYEKEKMQISEIVSKVTIFKSNSFTKFNHFYRSFTGNKKISFHDKLDVTTPIPSVIKENGDKIDQIKSICRKLKEIDSSLNLLGVEIEDFKATSKTITSKVWNIYLTMFRKYWKAKFNLSIKKKIDILNRSNNGVIPKPNTVGLLERFVNKKNYIENVAKFENMNIEEQKLKEYFIPDRKEVYAIQSLTVLDLHTQGDVENRKKFSNKGKIDILRKAIKKLSYNSNLTEIAEKFSEFSSNPQDYYVEEVKIKDKNGDSNFSNGEKAHLLLHNFLEKDVEYFLLDEPSVFLSKESITDFLIPKISELSKSGKKIVIVSHNNSMGINTIPINYIYRKYINAQDECQTFTGSIWTKKFTNINDPDDILDFRKIIVDAFEGGDDHFDFRKEIYENKL